MCKGMTNHARKWCEIFMCGPFCLWNDVQVLIVKDRENLNIPDWGLCRLAPILVHIDEFRACLCLAFWELKVRTSRCPGCRPSNSFLGKPEPVGQQLWICPLLPCLQRHTFHIIIFISIFDNGKPSQLTNEAKFS